MNRVTYDRFEFSDADLTLLAGSTASLYWSPLGDELRAGECCVRIQYWPRAWSLPAEEFRIFDHAAPLDLYQDATLLHRFYLTSITGGTRLGDGSYQFELRGTDFAGLFATVPHRGGVYSGASAGAVIAEILGATQTGTDAGVVIYQTADGIEYIVAEDIDAARIDNWLPITDDARSNLRTVLQITGAMLTENALGVPFITGLEPGAALEISKHEIYMGDAYETAQAVTGVRVIEYAYVKDPDAAEEMLYDATDISAVNSEVLFDAPYFGLRGDGLTIHEAGANYAIVSGQGILYGKKYTQITRTLSASTDKAGAENIRTIDNTLCSSLYSAIVLSRMQSYFSTAETVRHAVAMPSWYTPGELLAYDSPTGDDAEGYPTEMALTFSGITKADQRATAGWSPSDEAPYTESQVITAGGTWTPPAGATRLRFVLIGGGTGGYGGYAGEKAEDGTALEPVTDPGLGGDPGEPGDGGKVLQIDLEQADIAASYTVTVGAAGAAGAIDHGAGTEGGATTLTDGVSTWTSADGARYRYGVVDILTGIVYAKPGTPGVYAGLPGTANATIGELTDTYTGQGSTTTWYSGAWKWYDTQTFRWEDYGGGGAAYGSDGGAPSGLGGGTGADAALDGFNGYSATPTVPGTGGTGGNGGGGGGIGTDWHGGYGGHGSVGSAGAPGAVLVLIAYGQPPTPPDDRYLFDADGEALYDYNYERLKEARE